MCDRLTYRLSSGRCTYFSVLRRHLDVQLFVIAEQDLQASTVRTYCRVATANQNGAAAFTQAAVKRQGSGPHRKSGTQHLKVNVSLTMP